MKIKQTIARFLLYKVWGFHIETEMDVESIKKKIYAIYPHTSNWDFLLGILSRMAMPIKVNYVAKDSLFVWPFGYLFRALGGLPVDRSKRANFVEQMIKLYDENEVLAFGIAPEGTRKKVTKFKSGFYHIAVGAKIPIIFVKFDFAKKLVSYSKPFWPTGDYNSDLKIIIEHFRGTVGLKDENTCQWEDQTFL